MKARYLAIGLLIGALWGLLSTVVFVTVGMFGDNRHPYHWLFQVFQNSMHTLWFRALFLPFLVSFEAGFMFAFFGSTPVGATIGTLMGAVASVLNYRVRKNGQSHSSRKMKESESEGLTNCDTETISSHLQHRILDKCTGDKEDMQVRRGMIVTAEAAGPHGFCAI